ncbi:MAG: hypothetical protein PHQ81_04550, partial [Methanofollis sp.]|nr:hypothetical protein [Methanofollis sp.]
SRPNLHPAVLVETSVNKFEEIFDLRCATGGSVRISMIFDISPSASTDRDDCVTLELKTEHIPKLS